MPRGRDPPKPPSVNHSTDADRVFLFDLEDAQRKHDRACRCRTKAGLSGKDGPDIGLLHAALTLAYAIHHGKDAAPALRDFRYALQPGGRP